MEVKHYTTVVVFIVRTTHRIRSIVSTTYFPERNHNYESVIGVDKRIHRNLGPANMVRMKIKR